MCNVYKCERSTLEKLLERIDGYRLRGEKSVYVIGYNIKAFDLPILSYRLYKTNIVSNVGNALDLMLGVYKGERRITYLDIIDIVKALVFPKVRGLKAYRVAEASSRCLGEDVRLTEDAGYLEFLKETCMGRLCKDEAMLNAETKEKLRDKVRKRLGEDLRRLTTMYRLLLAPGKEGREKNIQCLTTELSRIVDEC
jgi:DNA polymerase elongation subunit (family B)